MKTSTRLFLANGASAGYSRAWLWQNPQSYTACYEPFLCEKAEPSQLVLCAYTEKAARELHDRITSLADKVNYQGDMSLMRRRKLPT
jgi:hypothetical protein